MLADMLPSMHVDGSQLSGNDDSSLFITLPYYHEEDTGLHPSIFMDEKRKLMQTLVLHLAHAQTRQWTRVLWQFEAGLDNLQQAGAYKPILLKAGILCM
ncbi:hypothetical protein AVEN_164814-1 [Araneus ventricosus]|uniref:Uncharacterized protein n=1 Tax=Araneus ventricosus TaxID=182803 RepID=A0A4Y2VZR6_ARAVE|nr:hypothetical protein AVEN_164814-1 [Araneus ventricosus]